MQVLVVPTAEGDAGAGSAAHSGRLPGRPLARMAVVSNLGTHVLD